MILTLSPPGQTGTAALDRLAGLGYLYVRAVIWVTQALMAAFCLPLLVAAAAGDDLGFKNTENEPIPIVNLHEATPNEARAQDRRTDGQKGIYRFNEGETGDDDADHHTGNRIVERDGAHHGAENSWDRVLRKYAELRAACTELDARLRKLEEHAQGGVTHAGPG